MLSGTQDTTTRMFKKNTYTLQDGRKEEIFRLRFYNTFDRSRNGYFILQRDFVMGWKRDAFVAGQTYQPFRKASPRIESQGERGGRSVCPV